ncbi:MAG: single-stranded-DNA-specific exonuclease RecJ [Deltaproteobacteria bacterium]|nr:single-stranded-DNA-specific exonuclease RecJ [Deltaproteobacteria bacterium]
MIRPKIISKTYLHSWYQKQSPLSTEDQIVQAIIKDDSLKEASSFFKPALKDIPDPVILKDMKEVVQRVIQAINEKGKILILGDYDVDGISSSALIFRFFQASRIENFEVLIPSRFKHGYGLTQKIADEIVIRKPSLVLTVDNGICSKQEVSFLQDHQIEVIITDHHLPILEQTPECLVINPKQESCPYPEKNLAGVGIAFLFLTALRTELRTKGFWSQSLPEPNLLKYLDLVALGTIADQVPLLGLNRLFVKFGLEQMDQKALDEGQESDSWCFKIFYRKNKIQKIDPRLIAFRLAPMINAAGRLGEADKALNFLVSDDQQSAEENHNLLAQLNRKRQKKQQSMSKAALEKAEVIARDQLGVLLYDPSFHEGLIGIIASRIMESLKLPTIILADGLDGIIKGSCRSYNINMFDFLHENGDLMAFYGGHANAAGLSITKENLVILEEKYYQYCKRETVNVLNPKIETDLEVTLEMCSFDLIERLKLFEPYGLNNDKPVFMLKDLKLPEPKIMMEKHLKWNFGEDLEMIYWNGVQDFSPGSNLDIAFTLEENLFRGERKRQLLVKAISQ